MHTSRNGSLRENLSAADSPEYKRLKRAIAKANGDRELAMRLACRAFGVRTFDRLPPGVMAAAASLIADL